MADIIFFQEILTAEGKKMRAVADYWARMKKGERTLDSWDLTYLECKIFSWSLEDVLNKNLLKEKVWISHPLPQTRHSIRTHSTTHAPKFINMPNDVWL
jgi:hypothetical protein